MIYKTITIKKIKDILKDNKAGITLNLNGLTANNKKGYYCSITNNIFKTLHYKDIYNILKKAKGIKNKKHIKTYIGFWSNNNINYLDITLRFLNKNKAINTGLKYNQKAIFNLNKLECININRGGINGNI